MVIGGLSVIIVINNGFLIHSIIPTFFRFGLRPSKVFNFNIVRYHPQNPELKIIPSIFTWWIIDVLDTTYIIPAEKPQIPRFIALYTTNITYQFIRECFWYILPVKPQTIRNHRFVGYSVAHQAWKFIMNKLSVIKF